MRLYRSKRIVSILLFVVTDSVLGSSFQTGSGREFQFNGKTYTYDEAMTMEHPPEGVTVVEDDTECKQRAESIVGMSQITFDLLALSEGGYNGMAKAWPAKGGGKTWDTGKYSINEINWPKFDGKLSPFDLRWNDCASLVAAATILDEFYREAERNYKKDIVDGVDGMTAIQTMLHHIAGYNSRTPSVRKRYQNRLATMLGVIFFTRQDKSFWGEN